MFHINETYLNLLFFYLYRYWYVCAIDKKCRWRYIPADFTSPFLYAVEKKLLIITYEKQEVILLSPITKPPRNFNVYSIIWRYFESLKDGVFYFIKYMIWAVASCSNSMMHVYFHNL